MCARKLTALLLTAVLMFAAVSGTASAKTAASEKAENVFFYAESAEGKSVLLKVLTLDELKAISHGQPDGNNYQVSSVDNYPTTQYLEARGFTVPELVDYVRSASNVTGAEVLSFSGSDTLYLMATDGYGNYSRSWSYNELYGVKRYYFEGLYDREGWHMGWEIAGEDNSKFGITLEEYNSTYKDADPYYDAKRAVFETGVETEPILATMSASGRTTSETLVASTEPGIASYIEANGGMAAGSLKNILTDEHALRLCLPMTEADLMAAHRTAYDNFKWIYGLLLDMADAPSIRSLGTVAAPEAAFSLEGDSLVITFSCTTSGAAIYYGFDGAAQKQYTEPITVDVSGRDLNSDPITVYAVAVKEGYDDAGMQTYRYPGAAPQFKTVYSGMTEQPLCFAAADSVTASEWQVWTKELNFVSIKTPVAGGYVTVDTELYSVDNAAKTVTFAASLFDQTGSYSFIFHNTQYANKTVSVTMKKAAPEPATEGSYIFGQAVTVTFADNGYQKGLSVYVTPEGGRRTMISAGYLDRTQAGRVSVKAEYFAAASTAMAEAGTYTLELVNNSYAPASQTVTIHLVKGFADVSEVDWYYTYVTELAADSIIDGMSEGVFAPKGTLTWGQALKLLMLSTGYEEQPPTGDHWASGYMAKAAEDGLAAADIDPDAAISRLDFCKTAAKALKAETTLNSSPFKDTADHGVLALYELGIIDGVTDDTFAPNDTLTRAQIAKIIWCIRNLEV